MCRLFAAAVLFSTTLLAQNEQPWVAKSNQNAQLLLTVMGRYSPEDTGQLGVNGLDQEITKPSPDLPERMRRDLADALRTLQSRLASEKDPLVRQDLQILIDAVQRRIKSSETYERFLLPYDNVASTIFSGMQALLDDQVEASRRPAALVRLKKYTGLEEGYTPITVLAEQVFRSKENTPGLLGPSKTEVDQDLATIDQYSTGIGLLLEKYKMTGYEEGYRKLRDQLTEYQNFVRSEVLPRARADFRLPPEVYTVNLANRGIDYSSEDLVRLAHQSFSQIQQQMQPLAEKIASQRNLPSSDYRDVIKQLKKDQLQPDQVMPLYHDRLSQIEAIIAREHLVTLPSRPCIIRQASAAETAQQPAPHMVPPPLINNHGEQGQFVLPGGTTGPDGKPLKYDDFTFSAAAWTLTAHEARPGHELQFAAMVERGVSQARGIFAFNSTNVEGWGLYAEWMMLPYMPDEGKLVSLDYRLLRAARAFLDPELQQGKITPEQAKQVLLNDVVASDAFATQEVDRYTFRAPGQAGSYFDGYTRLMEIRSETEKALGPKFNAQKFHDFILSQGLLPPNLLRAAVQSEFIPAAK